MTEGDEIFRNGIFEFNITEIIKYMQESPDEFILDEVLVDDFMGAFSSLNQSHIDTVDINKPIIIAEISPGQFNIIDGNHRLEKAHRLGIKSLPAYRLLVEQHIRFLTSKRGYLAYIEYWNSKLK